MTDPATSSTTGETHQRRRKWPWIVAVLLLIITAYATWVATVRHQVNLMLSDIRTRGEPANAAELDAWYERVPAGEPNQAEAILDALTYMWIPSDDDTLAKLPLIGKASLPKAGEAWPPEVREAVDDLLKTDSGAIQRLVAARGIQKSRYPVNLSLGFMTPLADLSRLRTAINLLELYVLTRIEDGDAEGAINGIEASAGLARSLQTEPVLIAHLVRIAMVGIVIRDIERLLNNATLTKAQLVRLDDLLAPMDLSVPLARAMAGELAMGNDIFALSPSKMIGTTGISPGGGLEGAIFAAHVASGMIHLDHLTYLQIMEDYKAAAQEPEERRTAAMEAVERRANELGAYPAVLTRLIVPGLARSFLIDQRYRTSLRVARVVIAIERYRLCHGKLPMVLDELTPEFLPQALMDPFTGKPLIYKTTANGYVVYSVGEDGVDNGGVRTNPAGKEYEAGSDISIEIKR
ncbi:MAG: hypothetical protein GC162_18190 [Planctomycetes bacterium]|nr:hypothetical protein [Planctomycetota bacterium]